MYGREGVSYSRATAKRPGFLSENLRRTAPEPASHVRQGGAEKVGSKRDFSPGFLLKTGCFWQAGLFPSKTGYLADRDRGASIPSSVRRVKRPPYNGEEVARRRRLRPPKFFLLFEVSGGGDEKKNDGGLEISSNLEGSRKKR